MTKLVPKMPGIVTHLKPKIPRFFYFNRCFEPMTFSVAMLPQYCPVLARRPSAHCHYISHTRLLSLNTILKLSRQEDCLSSTAFSLSTVGNESKSCNIDLLVCDMLSASRLEVWEVGEILTDL